MGARCREFESPHSDQNVLTKEIHSRNTAQKCGISAFQPKIQAKQKKKVEKSKIRPYFPKMTFQGDARKRKIAEDLSPCGKIGVKRQEGERS